MLVAYVSFFNELSIENKKYSHSFSLIMASKRTLLWNKYMSKDKHQPWLPGDLH
jgi:hypothetical protein